MSGLLWSSDIPRMFSTLPEPTLPIVNERISINQQLSDDDFVTAYDKATEDYTQAELRICDKQGGMFTDDVHDRMDAIAQANVDRLRGKR